MLKNIRDEKGRFVVGHVSLRKRKYERGECFVCGKEKKSHSHKFCSYECYYSSKRGKSVWWGYKIGNALRGKPKSPSHIEKVSKALKGQKRPHLSGEKSPVWKGDGVGYSGLHDWVSSKLGYPKKCEHCGRVANRNNGRWNVHWANRSHKYMRNLTDWLALCRRCHYWYDKEKAHLPN